MKFVERRPFADPDLAARKLVEIANGVEAVQDGRIYIERVNAPFLATGGSGEDFRAGMARAIALGWLWRREGGTYLNRSPRRRRRATDLEHSGQALLRSSD
jgi:hypothetical protein